MLATAFWLFQLTTTHLGKTGAFRFGIFLVVLALACWLWGEFVQRGQRLKAIAMAASGVLLCAAGVYALSRPQHIQWQSWSPQAVAQARSANRPVLVDFTADWCLTCQVNKKSSLEAAAVEAKLKQINAVTLIGDYTRKDEAITEELKRFKRAGVPLVLVFPKDSSAAPIVLPEVLTPGAVIDALDRASR
jgi:thiol:disulfide interchange protein DsbD